MCTKLGFRCYFSSLVYLQANGQVKSTNKVIKHHLKTQLSGHKRAWADQLPGVIWVYKTTPHNATTEMSYFLAFRIEAVIPIKVGLPSHRIDHFSHIQTDDNLRAQLDLLEEKQEVANLRAATYKECSMRYYNSRVKQRIFRVGDLVLRKVKLNTKEAGTRMLSPTWEGPY